MVYNDIVCYVQYDVYNTLGAIQHTMYIIMLNTLYNVTM